MAPPVRPLRITAVLTHPTQYFSPWFRHIAARHPEVALTVLYGAVPSAAQQGEGFGTAFAWDVPLLDGYEATVCGDAEGKPFGSDRFFGLDVPDIQARIAATHPDVVLIHGWHAVLQVRALRACRRLGLPVLYRGDSTLESGPSGWRRPLWRLKTRVMLRQFDGYLNVGTAAFDYLRAFATPEPLIARSPHAVDNAFFAGEAARRRQDGTRDRLRAELGAAPEDLVVLFAGKLQPKKRPLDAVRAVAAVGEGTGARAHLLIAGDGPLAPEVQAEAARLGLRVGLRGFLNQSQMPDAYAAADCLLLPSDGRETWGLVVNEALASGLPCVVTDRVGAGRDLVGGGDGGWVVGVGDIDAMARRLRTLGQWRLEGVDMAPACRARVAAHDFAAATDGLVAMARRVVARRQVPVPRRREPRVIECCGHMVSIFGLERMTFEVLRALRDEGAAVHCIVNQWESSPIVELAEDIGASWSTGYYRHEIRRRHRTARTTALAVWDVLRTSAGLLRDAWRFRPTHVALPEFTAVLRNLPALLVLRACGVRVFLRLGNAPDEGLFYRRVWQWLVAPAVDVCVANSRFTEHELVSHGVPRGKVRMIYNGPPSRNEKGPLVRGNRNPFRVIYVGQLIPPKGAHLLLEAVAGLAAKGLPVTLDIVGNIDGWEADAWRGYRADLRSRADREDLQGRVRFLGVREDVPQLLASASIHCCPSLTEIREGFGVVVVEAKLEGTPSVVTTSGALPELVEHRVDGWVCREASVEAIMEGLEYLLADAGRLATVSAAARASSDRFSRARFRAAWLRVFGIEPLSVSAGASQQE